jgi:thioredoxin reductase (NADPH)
LLLKASPKSISVTIHLLFGQTTIINIHVMRASLQPVQALKNLIYLVRRNIGVKVVVVGGGDTAMEDASFLSKFTTKITIIQLLDKLTASQLMQKRVLENPKIKIIYNNTVTSIHGDKSHITDITIFNQKTKEQQKLNIDGLFLAIGLKPNSDPFKNQLDLDKWGYIKLTNHTTTSVKGVFAAGDVTDPQYRQAITSAGSGCMAALDAERYLVTNK